MEFEATTQGMSPFGKPGPHLVPTDSAYFSQSNISSSEYNQYPSLICVGAHLSRSTDIDDKCAETSGIIMEESMSEGLITGELKKVKCTLVCILVTWA